MFFLARVRSLDAQVDDRPRSPSRAVLFGQVVDDSTAVPLAGVRVAVAGTTSELLTDTRGYFIISLTVGDRLALSFRRLGYRPHSELVEVRARDTTRVSFFMVPAVPMLDTLNVTAEAISSSPRLEGFERRRHLHIGGTFVTRDEIEKRNVVSTLSLFLNIPGVRIVDSAGVKLLASMRGAHPTDQRTVGDRGARRTVLVLDLAPCYMAVGVDGQVKDWGFSVDEINPRDIYGIEVYNGPSTMPREFASLSGGFCGLVMLWTRAD